MLLYLGKGVRRYGLHPFGVTARPHWEFQAVLRGSIGMRLDDSSGRLRQRWLWLSPPGHPHGWTGDGRKPAEVAVFHFPSIPEPLRRLAQGGAPVEMALTADHCRRIQALADRAQYYRDHPAPGMMMNNEHILLELSLMIYEAKRDSTADTTLANDRRVGEALRWFAERIHENPSQENVARAVNVSPAHLRRLFHEVLKNPPKRAFDQLRFQHAIELMSDPALKLSAVSAACGFESQSAFSRAFKAKFGCAPEIWRG
jgi:AraC family transcriptional regulator